MNEIKSIFNVQVDEQAQYNLKETAKWAKFLAVLGMIFVGIMLLLGSVMTVMVLMSATNYMANIAAILGYILVVIIYVYPIITLFRFGKGMKIALQNNDNAHFNNSILNLKKCFKFIGITTIIMIGLYLLFIIIFLFSNAQDLLKFV